MRIAKVAFNFMVRNSKGETVKSLLCHTKLDQVFKNIKGLQYATALEKDSLHVNSRGFNIRNLENKIFESKVYDVTKYQKDFFKLKYDKLKSPEERAIYTEKLRCIFDKIQYKKECEYDDLANGVERINFIKENFQFLHHYEQKRILSILEGGQLPERVFFRDNNKMFELVLKDKKYNFDYVEEMMNKKYYNDLNNFAPEFSKRIDEYLAKMRISLPKSGSYKIPQQMRESEIDRALYYHLPYYHGVKGPDADYKIQLFKEHGLSRFGPTNIIGTNMLFTTNMISYAKEYGRPIKMYLSKEYPIIDIGIKGGSFSDRSVERLFYDLCYEKGIKFIENDRETLILDPKAITFVTDFIP